MRRTSIALAMGLAAITGAPALADQTQPVMPMPMPMAGPPTTIAGWAQGARHFDGMAHIHRAVTTASAEAQAYFDQGMALMWGFNHDEAARSFARAAAIDPHCAMCFWGLSLTVGPNYNLPYLTADRAKVAFEAMQRAQAEMARATPVEQALITALGRRYPGPGPLDTDHLLPVLADYAAALTAVARAWPDDLDVQVLHAESLMNLHAWKLWTPQGEPAPDTTEIVATLKSVLARDPGNVGANHYFIHAIEASPHPEDGLPSAERLKDAAPGEGHLLHMPSHIQQRVGQYEAAADANRRGVMADLVYADQTNAPDYYPVMYTGHNYQFLAFSAAMEGRRAETLEAVDGSREVVTDAMLYEMPGMDWYLAESYGARVRFGLWDQMLAMPAPDAKLPGLRGGYLYGLAMAQAATGRIDAAKASRTALAALAADRAANTGAGQNVLKDVLAVAVPSVDARIARAEHRAADELAALRAAVTAESRLSYDEPWNWFVPTRQVLGEALLRQGAPAEAEAAYRDDLRQNPANGWALKGLALALTAQHKTDEAARTEAAFRKAWQHADTDITASAF
jgi:tetratricopeptide (TPR) repeat protein